jgi:hypothetical protein
MHGGMSLEFGDFAAEQRANVGKITTEVRSDLALWIVVDPDGDQAEVSSGAGEPNRIELTCLD